MLKNTGIKKNIIITAEYNQSITMCIGIKENGDTIYRGIMNSGIYNNIEDYKYIMLLNIINTSTAKFTTS